jgi:hypothetical protein
MANDPPRLLNAWHQEQIENKLAEQKGDQHERDGVDKVEPFPEHMAILSA